MAQVGSWASHKVHEILLRYIFVVLLVYISLNMLGVSNGCYHIYKIVLY